MATEEQLFEEMIHQAQGNDTIFEQDTNALPEEFVNLYLGLMVTNTLIGLSVHTLIITVIITRKRLRSWSMQVIAHWLVCDGIALKLLPTLFNVTPLHRLNFTIHIILFNFILLFGIFNLLFLNILINDTIMKTNRYDFKKLMDWVRLSMAVANAIIIFWKLFRTDAYLELVMVLVMTLLLGALFICLAWKQLCRCIRMCRCSESKTDSITELRLHLPTFYLLGHLAVYFITLAAHTYSAPWLSILVLFWNLNGFYVLGLLLVKDTNFRVVFMDFVCCRKTSETDMETQGMINSTNSCDKEADDVTTSEGPSKREMPL